MVNFEVLEIEIQAETSSDLFSPKGLDQGTELLIDVIDSKFLNQNKSVDLHEVQGRSEQRSEAYKAVRGASSTASNAEIRQSDRLQVLDWGCGWGAISLAVAKKYPDSKVTAIDSDIQAVKLTIQNAKLNNLTNISVVASHGFDDVPSDTMFNLILSNPPTHRGREVVEEMISQSFEHLSPKGSLVIVVEARLKPWVNRQMKSVFGNCKIVARSNKHVVLSAQKELK